jgi:hypothetical protein
VKIFDLNKNGKTEFWEIVVVVCVGYTVIDVLGILYRLIF